MKILLSIALAALAWNQVSPQVLQTTAGPLSREHWQRILTPPDGMPRAEQCVVLDADVFANAAPGLRDVRLLQGNRELQYAVDESHDDRETVSGKMPLDDRSIFDPVGVAAFGPADESSRQKMESLKGQIASLLLPAHVPVERITLRGATDVPVQIRIEATPSVKGAKGMPDAEVVSMQASAGQASLMVTLGANLQHPAVVIVAVSPEMASLSEVALEMRRREICYQPITDESVRMVFGDKDAEPVHYDYASRYKPTATPALATMGPRMKNTEYLEPARARHFAFSLKDRLGIAIGLCVGMLVVTLGALLAMRR